MIRVYLNAPQNVAGFCTGLGLRQALYNKDRQAWTTKTSGGLTMEIRLIPGNN